MTHEKSSVRITDSHGKHYPLSERVCTLGRAPDCDVILHEKSIPSYAAHIMFGEGGYHIQPLDDGVRLRINDEQCKTIHTLRSGDTFAIGKDTFVFSDETQGKGASVPEPTTDPIPDIIDAVVQVLRKRDTDILPDITAAVSRLLRCDAARVVMEDLQTKERTTRVCWPADAGNERFSSHAIDWAVREGGPVLMQHSEWREEEDTAVSLEINRVATILCAPLISLETSRGFLYLDRQQGHPPFNEQDRRLCASLVPLFAVLLQRTEEHRRQRETIARLQTARMADSGIMCQSAVMRQCLNHAQTFAKTDAAVLLTGETGTGKELLARLIHDESPRKNKPFVAINCGALPDNLVESELFRYEKGAFTGANSRKNGIIESANGGTLLLDEIGDMPLPVQVKVLRFLQQGDFLRVGGREPIQVNVRIIAATNRSLEKDVEQGRFRKDLFYRLHVLTLTLPPLRDRHEDIPLLARFFLSRYADQFGLPFKRLSNEALSKCAAYHWPGNIRELENCMQKALLLSQGSAIEPDAVTFHGSPEFGENGGRSDESALPSLKQARIGAETKAITQTLARTGGNISMASRILQIDRAWLTKRIEEYGIDVSEFR